MSLRHALLGALADRPRSGYELLKHFEGSLAYAWSASHSQIYPELARLVEDELIEQTESGPRGSKTYGVTEAGIAEVRRWLRESEPDRRVRSEAALRLFFLWLLEPEEARAHLERERTHWLGVLRQFENIAAHPREATRKDDSYRLALEAGITSARARLEWLDATLGPRPPEG